MLRQFRNGMPAVAWSGQLILLLLVIVVRLDLWRPSEPRRYRRGLTGCPGQHFYRPGQPWHRAVRALAPLRNRPDAPADPALERVRRFGPELAASLRGCAARDLHRLIFPTLDIDPYLEVRGADAGRGVSAGKRSWAGCRSAPCSGQCPWTRTSIAPRRSTSPSTATTCAVGGAARSFGEGAARPFPPASGPIIETLLVAPGRNRPSHPAHLPRQEHPHAGGLLRGGPVYTPIDGGSLCAAL